MKVRKLAKEPRNEPPIKQPGGVVLSEINTVCIRWIRGDIYSDEAIENIGDVVARNEFFEGLLECAGWVRSDDD